MTALDEPRSHPDPERLGAFLEGNLPTAERRDIAQHIERCSHCIFVIRETSRYERENGTRTWTLLRIAAGITIALLSAAIVLQIRNDPVRRMAMTVRQTGVRTFEGRIAGFEHARYMSDRSNAPADTAVYAAAEGVLSQRPKSARDRHAQGVANLLIGQVENSVAAFSEAVRLAPRSPAYRSDLAAARISLGTARSDGNELRRALDDADRALQLDPKLPEALFNRAVALERLGAASQASHAYAAYLSLDSRSPWAAEVRWRIERLRR